MKPHLELLQLLGYEEAGQDPDDRQKTQWLYQGCLPHILISLPPEPSVIDVHYAIRDAGRRSYYDEIKACQEAFSNKFRYFKGTDVVIPPLL